MIGDVLRNLRRRQQLLGVVVWNLEAELVLHGHDDLHVVERVQAQIVDKVGIQSQLEQKGHILKFKKASCSPSLPLASTRWV